METGAAGLYRANLREFAVSTCCKRTSVYPATFTEATFPISKRASRALPLRDASASCASHISSRSVAATPSSASTRRVRLFFKHVRGEYQVPDLFRLCSPSDAVSEAFQEFHKFGESRREVAVKKKRPPAYIIKRRLKWSAGEKRKGRVCKVFYKFFFK